MNETVHPPSDDSDPFARAREQAAGLGRAGDPVAEYPLAMPTKPEQTAPSKDRNAYKATERRVTRAADAEFADDLEGAMVMRDLTPFLRAQSAMEQPGVSSAEKLEKVRSLTEYQYLLAHFILQRSDDEPYMRQFWKSATTLAEKAGKSEQDITRLRIGVLSTVATVKALDALGYQPELAHPDQDAYDAVDVWTSNHQALQVKGAGRELEVYRTDDVEYPAVRTDRAGQGVRMISAGSSERLEQDLAKFATKVDRISAREGRPVEGLFVRIPYGRINHATGQPDQVLLSELRQYLEPTELAA
jgi:hypothetical protein